MHIALVILQVVVALILLNVWLLRFNKGTPYRAGNAVTMKQEFAVYGLQPSIMYAVGALKVGAALCLLLGLRYKFLVQPAALVIAVLMVGALIMHLRVHDAYKKSMPALVLLTLSLCIFLGARGF